jgi:MFS transporter, DHA3 family, macrolide efflux protein
MTQNASTGADTSRGWQFRFWTIWLGQALSLTGSALTQFVLVWWITETTGSSNALAVAGIAALLPQALLGPLGGTLADRLPRRLIMLVADSITALCTVFLVLLFATNSAQLWHIYTLMFIRSSMQAFHFPAFSASTPNLVPVNWIPKIAGFNQTLGGIMNIAAPPLGAFALAWLPIQGALMIDVVTAVLGIAPLLFYAIPQPKETQNKTSSLWNDFKEGLHFVVRDQGLLSMYLLIALVVLLVMPAISLIPLLVTKHFSGGPNELALMRGFSGVGIIAGGLLVVVLPRQRAVMTTFLAYALSCGAIALTALAPGNALWLAVIWFTLCGLSLSVGNAKAFAILLTVVPNHVQGRALSLLNTIKGFSAPLGLLLAGPIGEAVGVRAIYLWGGALCALVCLLGLQLPALQRLEQMKSPRASEVTQSAE